MEIKTTLNPKHQEELLRRLQERGVPVERDVHIGRQCPAEEFLKDRMGIVSPSLGARHGGVQAAVDLLHALDNISPWELGKLRQNPNNYINALEHAIFSQAEQIREKDKQIRRLKHLELLAKDRKKRKRGTR